MSTVRRRNPSYGINNPLQSNAPEPIVAQRAPTSADLAHLSTLWVDEPTNAYYVLTSPGVWTAQSTGSASQASLTLTGGSGTVLTVSPSGNTSLGGTLAVAGASTLSGALIVNSGTSAINIGTDAVAKTITLGNSTGGTAIDLNAGTGGVGVGSNAIAQPIQIGNITGATSVTILGGTAGAGSINIGQSSNDTAINIGNATGASPLSLVAGSGGATLTSTNSALTIDSGTGTLGISTDAAAGTVNVGTGAAAKIVHVGSTTASSTLALQTPTGTNVVAANGLSVTTAGRGLSLPGGVLVLSGAGAPSGSVTAPQGSLYLRTDGSSASTRAYINSDSGTTWIAVTTAS
jgi:hypothetical protein